MAGPDPRRVELARELREAGVSCADIAVQLGVARTTIFRWLSPELRERDRASSRKWKQKQRKRCPDCGRPMWHTSIACLSCIGRRKRLWTREAIVHAAWTFAEKYGRPPRAMDWNPAMAKARGYPDRVRVYYEDACYPPVTCVQREFGGWNQMIAEAGFRPFDHAVDHTWSPTRRVFERG
jgi:hypothetical protein